MTTLAMGGKGSGRKSTPEDQALIQRLKDAGLADPPADVTRAAKVRGFRAIKKLNKVRRKRGAK